MKKIVAIDFDETLAITDSKDHYSIHGLQPHAKEVVNWLHDQGFYIIIWTCRCKDYLEDAKNFLKENGVWFDAINENYDKLTFPTSKKIYYDILIDDKAIFADIDWLKMKKEIQKKFNKESSFKDHFGESDVLAFCKNSSFYDYVKDNIYGAIAIYKNPTKQDIEEIYKEINLGLRYGTKGSDLYVWNVEILHTLVERQLKIRFDILLDYDRSANELSAHDHDDRTIKNLREEIKPQILEKFEKLHPNHKYNEVPLPFEESSKKTALFDNHEYPENTQRPQQRPGYHGLGEAVQKMYDGPVGEHTRKHYDQLPLLSNKWDWIDQESLLDDLMLQKYANNPGYYMNDSSYYYKSPKGTGDGVCPAVLNPDEKVIQQMLGDNAYQILEPESVERTPPRQDNIKYHNVESPLNNVMYWGKDNTWK